MNLFSPTASYHRVLTLTGDEAAASRAHARAEKARIRKAIRKARVSREGDVRPTRDDMSVEHRFKMKRKAERNATMQPEFTPVPNPRVANAFNTAFMAFIQQGYTPVDAHNLALRAISSRLPAARMTRREPRPSKSDNPAYRKPITLKAFREARA